MLRFLKQVRAASSLLNPAEIRKRADQPVNIGLVASTAEAYAEMEAFLAPHDLPREIRLNLIDRIHRADEPNPAHEVDFVLYEHGLPLPKDSYTYDRRDPQRAVDSVLRGQDELALPLARQFPAFRKTAIDRFVHEVSRENALFTIATALPNVLPSVLELPWALTEFASDTVFLTANQVRMAFMIGAACGKDPSFSEHKADIISIGAGAFGWRALARELAGKIPLGGGLIPKGIISFAGTYVVGKGLEYYYHTQRSYTAAQREEAFQEGVHRGKQALRNVEPLQRPA